MEPNPVPGRRPERDECIEQAYFFRVFRDRLAESMPAQEILESIHQEILTTTRLPYAIEFLSTELKHSGLLGSGFARLPHYFTPFQTFVVKQTEDDKRKFTTPVALLVLEREALYKADNPTLSGLFVFQFETIARNRLGYDEGIGSMAADPFFGPDWADYIDLVRRQVGTIDFCDLVYLRSSQYVADQRRSNPAYVPPVPVLFGEKEGKIAKASRGRDPLFLFAALQRQLNYPEVPKPRPRDDISTKLEIMTVKLRELETRLRMAESELRGTFDPTQLGKPTIFEDEE